VNTRLPDDQTRPTERSVPAATDSVESPSARRRRLLRKALFGDWSPLLRDPLDLLRLSFAVASAAFALAGSVEYAVRLAGTFALVVAAQRLRLPRLFDALFLVGMWLQAWGNALRLFENISWWDNLVHLAVPFSSVPVLYVLLVRLGVVHHEITDKGHPLRHHIGLAIFAVAVGLSIGALYEVYEYVANRWLNAPIEIGYADTIFDLTLDAIGSLAGGVLLMRWAALQRSTERAAPV
jgi:hypothetical protein